MVRQTLPTRKDFSRLHERGEARINAQLILRYMPRDDGGTGRRLGVVVSNKHGSAPVVNRLKRVMREAFWATAELLPDDHDFMLIARAPLKATDVDGGMLAVKDALGRMLPRAWKPGAGT